MVHSVVVADARVPCTSVFLDLWSGLLSPYLVGIPPVRLHFHFGFHSDPFEYDPKKDLACMGDQSNCSIVCTLFEITFLGKWNECGERPLLWPLTSFPHIFCAFCPVLSLLLLWTVLLGPHQDLWLCDLLSDRSQCHCHVVGRQCRSRVVTHATQPVIGSLDKKDNTGVNTVLNTGLNTGVNTRVNTGDNT